MVPGPLCLLNKRGERCGEEIRSFHGNRGLGGGVCETGYGGGTGRMAGLKEHLRNITEMARKFTEPGWESGRISRGLRKFRNKIMYATLIYMDS